MRKSFEWGGDPGDKFPNKLTPLYIKKVVVLYVSVPVRVGWFQSIPGTHTQGGNIVVQHQPYPRYMYNVHCTQGGIIVVQHQSYPRFMYTVHMEEISLYNISSCTSSLLRINYPSQIYVLYCNVNEDYVLCTV